MPWLEGFIVGKVQDFDMHIPVPKIQTKHLIMICCSIALIYAGQRGSKLREESLLAELLKKDFCVLIIKIMGSGTSVYLLFAFLPLLHCAIFSKFPSFQWKDSSKTFKTRASQKPRS